MLSSDYETIPSNDGEGNHFKRTGIFAVIAIFLVGMYVGNHSPNSKLRSSPDAWLYYGDPVVPWPSHFVKQIENEMPLNTVLALEQGWKKSGDCVKSLGEPWLYGGEKSIMSSATIYFTPQVGYKPGYVSAIEVDYYGYIEEKLVGLFFSEERTSKDGKYHSVAVVLRDASKQDLCDTESPLAYPYEEYLAISPDFANMVVPLQEDSPELKENWKEGSCIPQMGFHYAHDVVGGKDITYKAENLVPVVPMYDSRDGKLNGVFFAATSGKQQWPDGCPTTLPPKPCATAGPFNYWDPVEGLTEANKPIFYFCSNFCDSSCRFEGSGSTPGMYATMHWHFRDTTTEKCYPTDRGPRPFCRSGEYPVLEV